MKIFPLFLVFLMLALNGQTTANAQNKIAVVPLSDDGDLMPVLIQPEAAPPPPTTSPFLDGRFNKPLVWNKGWDTTIGHRTRVDPSVNIQFRRLEPVFGYPGIIFTGQEIRQWGEQRFFNSPKRIYAKAVLMVDKGNRLEGGPFEWSLNNQGFISFHNIVRRDSQRGWIGAWTDPRPGEKVWFFIMSDDERFSSNPISFIWP